MPDLSEDDLHAHFFAYHINDRVPEEVTCPICAHLCKLKKDPFPPHLYNRWVGGGANSLDCYRSITN